MTIPSSVLHECAVNAVDKSSIVTFAVYDNSWVDKVDADSVVIDTTILLDLQAGGKRKLAEESDHDDSAPNDDCEEDEVNDEIEKAEDENDESVVNVDQAIICSMQKEIHDLTNELLRPQIAKNKSTNAHACAL
jgi:hypothetical protein